MSGALLVAGTISDVGKSVVTAGICRWLVRQGVSVAPFKAQNMNNDSRVTADGAEIGRAEVMRAAAVRVESEAAMNPVLLEPGGENSPDTDFAAVREARLDRLGDLIAGHADTDALWRLIEAGPPPGLPLLPPGAGGVPR